MAKKVTTTVFNEMDLISKLSKDVKKTAENIGSNEARYLVDLYYQMQDLRISSANQARVLNGDDTESHETIAFMSENFKKLEKFAASMLQVYAYSQPIGEWMRDNIFGVGPVIAAGLIAHIDIKKCETAGAIWRFAGLDPTAEWKKKTKRPWNAKLKVLCWKIGESFVKFSNNPKCFYGKLYKERKALEEQKNEAGEYAELAASILEKKNFSKDTEAYKAYSVGKLPAGHINARAKRYAVKIFLSHLFDKWYQLDRGCPPPKPFPIAILGHAHMIEAPDVIKE